MEKRKPNFIEALSPIIVMILLLGIGYGRFKFKVEPLLILSSIYAAIIAKKIGYSWNEIQEEIVGKISKSMPAILIILCVGLLIGSWLYSGTIPYLLYHGLQIINPRFLILTSFLITAIVSTITGTSWGSVGTAGVVLVSISMGLGVPLPATAGAVVAGAYFGDKMSPLSDTTNLAPMIAGSELYEHIKHMLYTTIPAALICIVVYAIVGIRTEAQVISTPTLNSMIDTLDAMYNWNIMLVVPVLIVLIGSITKKPTIPTMIISGVTAVIQGVLFQGFSLKNGFLAVTNGFNVDMINVEGFDSSTVMVEITKLLNRGGMMSMMGTLMLILSAMVFAGIISRAGCLEILLEEILKRAKTDGQLIMATVLSCITIAIVTGSSYLSIIIPGELFSDTYEKRGLAKKNLSRTLEDSGTVVVPIIPWSAAGAGIAGMLGVPTLSYLPWAILCYTGFIFAIIYGFTGFGIARIDSEKAKNVQN
jgi:Na+:H+ antiporter, NhaC family